MTRTKRTNSNHAMGTEHVPGVESRHAFKHGIVDEPPSRVKKNGAGRGNWGSPGDEFEDQSADFRLAPAIQRRKSNSQATAVSSATLFGSGLVRPDDMDESAIDEEEAAFFATSSTTPSTSSSGTEVVDEDGREVDVGAGASMGEKVGLEEDADLIQ